MKQLLFISTLFLMFILNPVLAQNSNIPAKTIQGQITHLGAPVPNVNINIAGTNIGTQSDVKGRYTIEVHIGQKLNYSHVSFKSISVVIEDITRTLNIELQEIPNELEETIITARKNPNGLEHYIKRTNVDIQLPMGTINPYKSGLAIAHIQPKDINLSSPSLATALNGKSSGITVSGTYPTERLYIRGTPATYVVNGMSYGSEPPIPVSRIHDIYIIKSRAMVVILLDDHPHVKKINQEKVAEQYRNQNFYNDDAQSPSNTTLVNSANRKQTKSDSRIISGVITYLEAPVPDVNIKIKNTNRGTKTNRKGKFNIKAKPGEILQFTHVSFKPVSVIIEDVTAELYIEMIETSNALDEIVVTAKTIDGSTLKRNKKADKAFQTSRGNFNPETAGYAVGFVDGKELGNANTDIKIALKGKLSGYHVNGINGKAYLRGGNSSVTQDYPVAWEVDGVFTSEEPIGLDINQVKSVHALKSLAATNKYGTLGAGGVIVITTHEGTYNANATQNEKRAEQYRNQSFYSNDAIALNNSNIETDVYINTLKAYNDLQNAYDHYQQNLKFSIKDYSKHITIANLFADFYDNSTLATGILMDLAVEHRQHPEKLKAIAFQLQTLGSKQEAIKLYQMIYSLRPKYAQSYRDLANAYLENDLHQKSWRLYMSYLSQGIDAFDEGIGHIIYNEMEYLYYNRHRQAQIKETFEPKHENIKEFKNDIRLVFEWNTSEAEFDLEFVSPDKRAYVFEHSFNADETLITNEKRVGYSSKEFMIDKLGDGNWLINLTYKGNKKSDPTYFKVTTYYNWGSSAQTKDILVFPLKNQRQKIQLFNFSKHLLEAFQ